jgi:hypothetical protein
MKTSPDGGNAMAIHIKPSHKGRLHRALGVPEGQPIPASKIAAAKNSSSSAVRKEATFAQNASHWNHGGSVKHQPSAGHNREVDGGHAAHANRHTPPPSTHFPDAKQSKTTGKGFAGHPLGSGTHGMTHGHDRKMC